MRFAFENLYNDIDLMHGMFSDMLRYSASEVIISDEKFNVIFSNSRLITDNKKHMLMDVLNPLMNTDIKISIENFKNSEEKNHILMKLIVNVEEVNNFPIEVNITKLRNKKNKIKGYCVFIQDITQDIKAKIQKETFIDIISHDLKTPMRANIQILELVLNGKFGNIEQSVKDILDELLNSCRFINYMAENLLIKYKNEFTTASIQAREYSIIRLIKNVCNKLMYILERKKQSIELIIDGNIPEIQLDVEKIGKVINNLLINSSEQSRENSSITIRITHKQEYIEVSFTDNGYPQKQENLNSIFDEYINCSNKFRKIGFGLEMYNCKKIIEAHNGSIRAESLSKNGTSITFSLPIRYSCCAG